MKNSAGNVELHPQYSVYQPRDGHQLGKHLVGHSIVEQAIICPRKRLGHGSASIEGPQLSHRRPGAETLDSIVIMEIGEHGGNRHEWPSLANLVGVPVVT